MLKNTILTFLFILSVATSQVDAAQNPAQLESRRHHYHVLSELGEGAFGKVYKVVDESGQEFAAKTFKAPDFDGTFAKILQGAHREYERGRLLDHPHIVKSIEIHHPRSSKEIGFLVLELVYGRPVYQVPAKALEGGKHLFASRELIDALYYAMTEGYLHTDLHQGNVMLTDEGHSVVIDLASFFNPDEIKALLTEQSGFHDLYASSSMAQFMAENSSELEQLRKQVLDQSAYAQEALNRFCYWQLRNITDICICYVNHSDLETADKVELRKALHEMIWTYEYDMEDNKVTSLEVYMEKLLSLLEWKCAEIELANSHE